jgi:hypothetical protein
VSGRRDEVAPAAALPARSRGDPRRRRAAAIIKTALAAIPAEVRAFALEVATVPDEERPGAIGELYKDEKLRTFAELMIDLEQEPAARALVVGELRRLSE